MTLGDTRSTIHWRIPAPSVAASAPFVTIAPTAANHTIHGAPGFATAIVAAVICPTSPHSEKKIAAKDIIIAFERPLSLRPSDLWMSFRHSAIATPMKLSIVIEATHRGGSL